MNLKDIVAFMKESGVKSISIEMQGQPAACSCVTTETVVTPAPAAEPKADERAEKKAEPAPAPEKAPETKPTPEPEKAPETKPAPEPEKQPEPSKAEKKTSKKAEKKAEPVAQAEGGKAIGYAEFVHLVETDDGTKKEEIAAAVSAMPLDDIYRVNNAFRLGLDTDVPEAALRAALLECF